MSDLRELYQSVILDHNRSPRNFGPLAAASHQARGHNPLCGDDLTVYVELDGDLIKDVRFEGSGCAISQASASLMTQSLKGKTTSEADALFRAFHAVVTGTGDDQSALGKLAVFAGVREFPMRVKCATLSWHTLRGALSGRGSAEDSITTE